MTDDLSLYATLALELAEVGASVPQRGGVFDGFNGTAFLDLAFATALDLSTPGELRPAASPVTLGGGSSIGTADYSAFTMVDRSYALTNGKPLVQIGAHSSIARSVTLKVAQLVSGTDTVVLSQTVSHPGGGMVMFPVSYLVPASGTFHIGVKYGSGNIEYRWAARAHATGDITTTAAFTEDTGNCPILSAVQLSGSGFSNMSAETVEIDTPSVPTKALVAMFAKLEGATLNTDLVVSVTRDLTDWLPLTMSLSHFRADGSACYTSDETDISGIASGSACKVRWRTFNGKSPRLLASGILFGTG